jgi:hypothetical protein
LAQTINKIAIVGSRSYPKLEQVRYLIDKLDHSTIIVSGHGGNVDLEAENYAKKLKFKVEIFRAKWRTESGLYDPTAGPRRNQLIVDASEALIAFYDGKGYKNSGTLCSVEMAAIKGIPFKIVTPHDEFFEDYFKGESL